MTQPLDVIVGPRFMADLQNDDLGFDKSINEIIANSIDSWIQAANTKTARKNKISKLKIDINYVERNRTVTIRDNALGMKHDKLSESLSFGLSSKNEDKKKTLGMYGFGLKGAASSLGGHLEVVTKLKGTNDYSHAVWEITESLNKNEMLVSIDSQDGEGNVNSKLPKEEIDKFTKRSNQGTLVHISEMHEPLPLLSEFMDTFETQWMWFTEKNNFGDAVEIKINGTKLNSPQFGKEDRDPVPNSIVEISVPIKWIGDRFDKNENGESMAGEEIQHDIKGKIWLNYGGGFNDGGFSLFRNLQNIAFRDHTPWKRSRSQRGIYAGLGGWWNNESWQIEGFLHLDCCVPDQAKTYFNTKTASWIAADQIFQNYMPTAMVHSKKGLKKRLEDPQQRDEFLANEWWPWFIERNPGLDMPSELKPYIITEDPETPEECDEGFHWDPVEKKCVPDEVPPEECDEGFHWDPVEKKCVPDEVPVKEFEIISEEKFKLYGSEYSIVIINDHAFDKIYDFKENGNVLQINVDEKLENVTNELSDILSKIPNDNRTKLNVFARRLIVKDILQEFLVEKLSSTTLTKQELAKTYANEWLINLYKS